MTKYKIVYYKTTQTSSVIATVFETGKNEVISAVYNNAVNSAGSLKIKISPQHRCYNLIEVLKGVMVLYKNDKIIFKSRVFSITTDDYNIKTIECEGLLAILNDSVVKPYKYDSYNSFDGSFASTGEFSDWVSQLFNNHNKQTNYETHAFRTEIGEDLKSLNFSCKNTNYTDTWSELKSKFINELGGYLWLEYSNNIDTTEDDILHFSSSLNSPCNQEIKYAVNLSSIERKIAVDDFATAIMPIGAEYENSVGNKVRTTIVTVNGGNEFLINENAVEIYGRINKVIEFNGVLSPADLLSLAQKKLEEILTLSGSLKVKAVDLSIINSELDSFDIGQKVRVISENHNTDMYVTISEIEIDLLHPQTAEYKLNSDFKSFVNSTNKKIYRIGE